MQKPTFIEEKKLWEIGYQYVIGMDEVGRGCFAGPIVAAGVIFDKNTSSQSGILQRVNDSKLLSPKLRKELAKEIKKYAFCYAITEVGVPIINKVGIGEANKIAFRKVIDKIIKQLKEKQNTFTLCAAIDGFHIKYLRGIGLKNQKAIIKGDQKSISIAAASIIAKVYRDNLMQSLHDEYPDYDFIKNMGYGTKSHRDAIKKCGLSKIHRKSFNLEKYL